MADNFTLSGFWRSVPSTTGISASGCPTFNTPISEKVLLKLKQFSDVVLDTDAVEPVGFGEVVNAHVIMIKASGKVTVRLTSAEGATQIIPVDTVLQLISESVPYTAIDLQRVVGQATSVKVFLGEMN